MRYSSKVHHQGWEARYQGASPDLDLQMLVFGSAQAFPGAGAAPPPVVLYVNGILAVVFGVEPEAKAVTIQAVPPEGTAMPPPPGTYCNRIILLSS
jgi:hypothetical protein